MNEEVYIVTGATGGIGRSIVKALVKRDVDHVVLACRNVEKAKEFIASFGYVSTVLTPMKLDLESFASVRGFVRDVADSGMNVMGLFNNAGTMPGKMKLTEDGYESATQVNFLATGLLTELLIPYMGKGCHIVFTTSMTRRLVCLRRNWAQRSVRHHSRFITYGRSKLMVTHYALALSARLAGRGIKVNCSDPGIVDSAIIKMDNKVIDWLSDRFFRPLVYSTDRGAAPAVASLDTDITSNMFTPRGCHPMSARYLYQKKHHIPLDAIRDIM